MPTATVQYDSRAGSWCLCNIHPPSTVFQRSALTRRLIMTSCHISARVLGPWGITYRYSEVADPSKGEENGEFRLVVAIISESRGQRIDSKRPSPLLTHSSTYRLNPHSTMKTKPFHRLIQPSSPAPSSASLSIVLLLPAPSDSAASP